MAGEPERIGNLILESLNRLGYAARLSKQSAVVCWPEIVGEKIAAESQAVRIDGDTLVVKVARPAWRQQLSFLKADLLAKVNVKIGDGYIRDIRFI